LMSVTPLDLLSISRTTTTITLYHAYSESEL
jgi:hypothetical protein